MYVCIYVYQWNSIIVVEFSYSDFLKFCISRNLDFLKIQKSRNYKSLGSTELWHYRNLEFLEAENSEKKMQSGIH